jgi:hypothetical protein
MPDVKFTSNPPSPASRALTSSVPVTGEPVESGSIPTEFVADEPILVNPPIPQTILIHILEDGFSAHGQIWYRGQEIEYITNEQVYYDTLDKFGNSWLGLDDSDQMRRYGRVYFRPGPWPGLHYEDETSAEAEKKRGRKPRPLASVVGGRR